MLKKSVIHGPTFTNQIMVAYRIEYISSVKKSFRNLSHDAQRQVRADIELLSDNPRPYGCIKLDAANNLWRIRSGDYRVVYEINDTLHLVTIYRIRHRREVYKKR
jgi:mRNA interferase RelE/StbE